jgi:hypothetical protein
MKWHVPTLMVLGLSLGGVAGTAQQQAPCSTPEYKQFDFWVGDWEVFDYARGTKGDLAGTNLVTRIFGGCAIQENWKGTQGGQGSSFNSYFSADKKWHQTWVDNSGYRLEIAGVFKDGKMILEGSHPGRQEGVTVTNRITWNIVGNDPNQVRQFWERSRDAGKTWEAVFDGLYVRKK